MISKYFAEIIWAFFFLFVLVAILPVFLMHTGHEEGANNIHSVYRIFCHQRVERTPFFLGAEGFVKFYSIEELQYLGAIPEQNPNAPAGFEEEIFGYPYIGDEVVGYKTALCIRDLSIYATVVIFGLIYLILSRKNKKIYKFDWKIALILTIPIAVDGIFQLIAELLGFDWVPQSYFDNQLKRIVTGVLFGIAIVMIAFPLLQEEEKIVYNNDNKTAKQKDNLSAEDVEREDCKRRKDS